MDGALMQRHDGLRDGKPETQAAELLLGDAALLKRRKDMRQRLRLYPHAGVRDGHGDPA